MSILTKLSNKNFLFSVFVAVAIIFFVGHRLFVKVPGRIEGIFSYVVYPVLKVQSLLLTPAQKFLSRRKERGELESQLHALKTECDELRARVVALEASKIFLENTAHVRAFERRYQTGHATLCQVIMRRFTPAEKVLFVDAGSRQGIVPDMVAVYRNCIVGRVEQVFSHYSKIITVADRRCKIASYCGVTKTQGIFQGVNQLSGAELAYVDRLKKLTLDESVVSSGDGTVFPRGFLLGTVVSFEPGGLHYHVQIKLALELEGLNYCYLIQKGGEAAFAQCSPTSSS